MATQDIWAWQQADTVEDELPNGTQVRLLIVSCAQEEIGHYSAYMSETNDYIKVIHGFDAQKFLSAKDDDTIVQRVLEWTGYQERAYMLAALKKVEVKAADATEWTETQLPDTWRKIATFAKSIPPHFYRLWRDKVVELNPNVFVVANTDEAKKKGKANAPALKNS